MFFSIALIYTHFACSFIYYLAPSARIWALWKQVFLATLFSPLLPVQFNSVAESYPTLCNPMNHSTTGLPVHHQLLEFTQSHIHWVGDAIQPSHPLSSPSHSALNPSQHQGQQTTSVFLLGESHEQRSLVGCSPSGCKGSGTAERLAHTRHIGVL